MFDLDQIPQIETERLVLRGIEERDFENFAAMFADAEFAHFLGGIWGRERCWGSIAWTLGHWRMRGYGMFAVDDKASGAYIGRIGPIWRPDVIEIEIGWQIARPFWNRGLATEGARAARDWTFATLRFEKVVHYIDPANPASIRVAEKLGAHYARDLAYEGGTARVYESIAR